MTKFLRICGTPNTQTIECASTERPRPVGLERNLESGEHFRVLRLRICFMAVTVQENQWTEVARS
jgi:hypothetical protein